MAQIKVEASTVEFSYPPGTVLGGWLFRLWADGLPVHSAGLPWWPGFIWWTGFGLGGLDLTCPLHHLGPWGSAWGLRWENRPIFGSRTTCSA